MTTTIPRLITLEITLVECRKHTVSILCMSTPAAFLRSFLTPLLVFLVIFSPSAPAQAPSAADEAAKLRAENQRLRQLLIERQNQVPAPTTPKPATLPATASAPTAPVAAQPAPLDHWLTLSSNKRHNSRCRYYQNSKGRACTAEEGIPCKICGG